MKDITPKFGKSSSNLPVPIQPASPQNPPQLPQIRGEHPEKPAFYRVVLSGEGRTPLLYMQGVLREVFHQGWRVAFLTSYEIHHYGDAKLGPFPLEVAEMKVRRVVFEAEKHGFPFFATYEKA